MEDDFAETYSAYRLSVEIKPGNESVYISSVKKDKDIDRKNTE